MISKITKMLFPSQSVKRTNDVLELAESIGEVSVESKLFGDGKIARIKIGEILDARLTVWGTGDTIRDAVKAALLKLEKAGIIEDLLEITKPDSLTDAEQ